VVKVQPKKGRSKVIPLALGGIAVLAGVAMVMNGGEPKPDTFPVDPSAPAPQRVEGYVMGNPDAPVRIREWADFECPACMQFATVTEPDVRSRLVETGQVRFEFFFFPLTEIHRSAASAAYAAACAGDQSKFWEMHDAIFQGFGDWAQGRARDPKGVFEGYAERIGLDVPAWSACYDSDKHHATIQSHVAAGVAAGVNSTPTFYVNDVQLPGAQGYDQIKAVVDSIMAATSPMAPGAAPGDSAVGTPVVPTPPPTQ
jgi:protein-disulfide isomerase